LPQSLALQIRRGCGKQLGYSVYWPLSYRERSNKFLQVNKIFFALNRDIHVIVIMVMCTIVHRLMQLQAANSLRDVKTYCKKTQAFFNPEVL